MKSVPAPSIFTQVLGLLLTVLPISVLAQTGVSDDRVSLPEGAGSVDGYADNVQVNPNMGMMTYAVKVQTPVGFPGLSPELSLNYSSAQGNGVAGMGWDMRVPSLERGTLRGLPKYDTDDEFVFDGSRQLVKLPGTIDGAIEYRERFESAFNRFRWHDAGLGDGGYWTVEYPDGRIAYFGANSEGDLDSLARSGETEGGVFRYHLSEMVDSFGHSIRYFYIDSVASGGAPNAGTTRLLNRVEYVFVDGSPEYAVDFEYEIRGDVISDAEAGYEEQLGHRLSAVSVKTRGTEIRRYVLSYENLGGGLDVSRLVGVDISGANGADAPGEFQFDYSESLGADCLGASCDEPSLVNMGTLGVDISSGEATLIDINGDALPDVVDTKNGAHRFFYNQLSSTGAQSFSLPQNSALTGISGFDLSTPNVHVLDVDGDGFTDLAKLNSSEYLRNLGNGDWESTIQNFGGAGLDLGAEDAVVSGAGELVDVRFLDYDNDKRVDIIRSTALNTDIYQALAGGGFAQDNGVATIGAAFDPTSDALELADMNGDGMLDALRIINSSTLQYRINYGYGQWSTATSGDWYELNFGTTIAFEEIDLEDLNGDDLADLVLVTGTTVQYALNRNGRDFSDWTALSTAGGTALPERLSSTTLLYADMNGNGSSDVVWVQPGGTVQYLELFQVRPNLLTSITNNLGMEMDVAYTSSVNEQASAALPWAYQLPHPSTVVTQTVRRNLLTGFEEITDYRYRDGFYDGVEKQFRGFANVEQGLPGDESQESGLKVLDFDVGQSDPYFAGLLLAQSQDSAGRVLFSEEMIYEDCEVSGLPPGTALDFDVRSVCMSSVERTLKEGRPEAEWVRTRQSFEYDGNGNRTLVANEGVVSIGGGACGTCERSAEIYGEACGPSCVGDEVYSELEYASPSQALGSWLTSAVTRELKYSDPNSPIFSELRNYYDGDAYVGLALGQVDKGAISRVEQLQSSGSYIDTIRNRHDVHGNVVEAIDANGSIASAKNRRIWEYDESGLRVMRVRILLEDESPYELWQDFDYDPLWHDVSEAGQFRLLRDGVPSGTTEVSEYRYDDLGRLSKVLRAGEDTLASPGDELSYEFASPVSQMVIKSRSVVAGEADLENVRCFDGFGRMVQERQRVSGSLYQVSGFNVFNAQGATIRSYLPYTSSARDCEQSEPASDDFIAYRYDSTGREVERILPDGGDYGGQASMMRREYLPLATALYDGEDNDPQSEHFNTPRIDHFDGLGRVVRIARYSEPGSSVDHQLYYDPLGNLSGYQDPGGNERIQVFDRLGRVLRVVDPDRGQSDFAYDDFGNRVRETDARGVSTLREYDGANRVVAEYEEGRRSQTEVTYHYDEASACPASLCTNTPGRPVEVRFPLGDEGVGLEWRGYDERGQDSFFSRTLLGRRFDFAMSYDNAGRLISTQYPNLTTVNYALDGGGRVTSIPGYLDDVRYNLRGEVSGLLHSNGVELSFEQDAQQRLSGIDINKVGGGALLGLDIARDRSANVMSIASTVNFEGPSPAGDFSYDAHYRLKSASFTGAGDVAEFLEFSYDDIDNMISKTSSIAESSANVGTMGYSASGPHQLSDALTKTLSYDSSGNLIRHGDLDYTWDFRGRLSGVSGESMSDGASFYYGGTRDRLVKEEGGKLSFYVSSDYEVRDGHALLYVNLGGRQLVKVEDPTVSTEVYNDVAPGELSDAESGSEYTVAADGAITAADAWINQAVESGVLTAPAINLAKTENLLAASTRRMLASSEAKLTHYHHDHLGNVVLSTDDLGNVVERYAYYPFGLERSNSGGTPEDLRFTGKEYDRSTGLSYFGGRYLDPQLGRWISPDPLFLTISASSPFAHPEELSGNYLFVNNNPTNVVDDDGRFGAQAIGAIAGFTVGFSTSLYRQYHIEGKQKYKSLDGGWAKTKFFAGVFAKATLSGAIGAVTGALSGGLSTISTAASTAIEVRKYKQYIEKLSNNNNGYENIPTNDKLKAKFKASLWGIAGAAATGSITGGISIATNFDPTAAGGFLTDSLSSDVKQKLGLAATGGGRAFGGEFLKQAGGTIATSTFKALKSAGEGISGYFNNKKRVKKMLKAEGTALPK